LRKKQVSVFGFGMNKLIAILEAEILRKPADWLEQEAGAESVRDPCE